jgi:AcrR family transcriptional regulator
MRAAAGCGAARQGWVSTRAVIFKQPFDFLKHLFKLVALMTTTFHLPPGGHSKRDRARLRLLEAGLRVFGEKGPRGATVREVARAAGQNVAAISYYFGNKRRFYLAVIEAVVGEIRARLGDVLGQIQLLRRSGERSPARATELLQAFLREVYLRMLSRDEAVAIGQLIVREQLNPTSGFELLYTRGFRELHEALCFLVGMALGRDPRQREVIVRTHMLMGQVYFFAMAREGILRRLGWKHLEGAKARWVGGLIEEHVRVLLEGLARQGVQQPAAPPAKTPLPSTAPAPSLIP